MNRREFIAGLGSMTAWAVVARAQQRDRVRRIGVLAPYDENDPEGKVRYSAFTQALADLGWTDGRNVRMDLRWGGGDINQIRVLAQELVGLQPDIILTNTTPATAAFQQETQTIPIVFASAEPVASGIVPRLDRPGGNITGFATYEPSLGGKWLELLSEIAPGLKRVAIIFNPDTAPVSAYMPAFEIAARSLNMAPIIAPVHNDLEIETAIIALGREPGRRSSRHTGCIRERASRTDHIGGGPKQRARGLLPISLCQRWRLVLIRARPDRHLSSCRHLCRSHSTRREPSGASHSVSN
jgi:putative ABC transport system substrate-binding protein